jgi:hypothetical protein
MERCTYAPSLNISGLTNSYTRSIINLEDIFHFDNNTVGRSRTVQEVATAPSWFKVQPQVITPPGILRDGLHCSKFVGIDLDI